MCFGEGHKLWFEGLEGGKNRSLSTEFILPVGEDSTLYKALKAVFSLGAVKEGDGVGKIVEERMDLICRNQDLEDALPDVSISLAWLARMLSPMFSLVIMPKMDAWRR